MAINFRSNTRVSNLRVGPLSGGGGGGGSSIPIETSGLQVFWDASQYGGSGTTLTDLSGNGNDGTIRNSPTYVSDGDASYFDIQNLGAMGANASQGIYNTDSSYYNIPTSTSFTVNLWVNAPNSASVPSTSYPLTIPGETTNGYSNDIFLDKDNDLVYVRARAAAGGNAGLTSVSSPPPGAYLDTWTSITMAVDSGTTLYQYHNGVLRDSVSITATMDSSAMTEIHLGYVGYQYGGSGNFGLFGKWNNFSLYNRALSASEVLSNYNALSSRF